MNRIFSKSLEIAIISKIRRSMHRPIGMCKGNRIDIKVSVSHNYQWQKGCRQRTCLKERCSQSWNWQSLYYLVCLCFHMTFVKWNIRQIVRIFIVDGWLRIKEPQCSKTRNECDRFVLLHFVEYHVQKVLII